MRFDFTPEQLAFRQEIRDFLKSELPPESDDDEVEPQDGQVNRAFSKKLADKGWIGLAWPKENGGQGLGYIERFVYNEEMVYQRAPLGYHQTAERQMGPSIILNGSEYQKKKYLTGIAMGEIGICIGYTEPDAGSDLANLKTTAVPDGDDYVINGQKIYTSNAHCNEYCWVAARTNPDVAKHKGISVFLVPMDAPGVEVQPLYTPAGSRYNIVFFNNTRVNARELVGQKDGGWYIVAQNLDFERSGIERVTSSLLLFEEVIQYARATRRGGRPIFDNSVVRNRAADLATGFLAGRMLAFRVSWMQSRKIIPNAEASISKVFGCELTQRASQFAMEVLGMYGQIASSKRWAKLHNRVLQTYLLTVSDTIRGGTSEIQRNVIATRGLGLPR